MIFSTGEEKTSQLNANCIIKESKTFYKGISFGTVLIGALCPVVRSLAMSTWSDVFSINRQILDLISSILAFTNYANKRTRWCV